MIIYYLCDICKKRFYKSDEVFTGELTREAEDAREAVSFCICESCMNEVCEKLMTEPSKGT